LVWNANPVYNHPKGNAFASAMGKVKLTVALGTQSDETAELCTLRLPDHHTLESWDDAEIKPGVYRLHQPTIQPLFSTRQWQDSLLAWMGADTDYYGYIRNYWRENVYPAGGGAASFKSFWNSSLHDGVAGTEKERSGAVTGNVSAEEAASLVSSRYGAGEQTDLYLYEKVGLGDGASAGNPWLQELPDPITKCTWDNYVLVPMKMAQDNGWSTGDVIKVTAGGQSVELPMIEQPGMHPQVVAVAVGYGRTVVGKAGEEVGQNVYPFAHLEDGYREYYTKGVVLEKVGSDYTLAITQSALTAGTQGRREEVVKERTLVEFAANPNEIKEERKELQKHLVNLYPSWIARPGENPRWGMAIDLNACTGCGACVIACQSENNIPVVGKKEVSVGREMHWIRVDRYYSTPADKLNDAMGSDIPEVQPEVVFQPMMCQHCDNAPCENVCPVLATVHSDEGLNQMVYNRCVGTRYCANNCPYKVRRFNWFNYTNKDAWQYQPMDDLGRMVLNPDVTVRARGVMEKCTFCVQRIQESKLEAKRQGRPLRDGEVHTACSRNCPSNAIVFGDLNDPNSRISQMAGAGHAFAVIEEVKALPSVSYLARVRNTKETDQQAVIA